MTTEELLKQALNEQLCRTQVANVTSRHAYDLYDLELTNNNITTTELAAISEVTGDDDLQIESRGNVVATIDDEMIEEIREQYE